MLLAFVTQLATTLLSSFSNCNYVFDFCKKTIEALNRIFWREKCYFSESTKTLRWKWAVTVVKRENTQISESIFGMFLMKEIRVSPQCHNYSIFLKKSCFYEHAFRSGGMYVYMYITQYIESIQIVWAHWDPIEHVILIQWAEDEEGGRTCHGWLCQRL
jgi:hypothetical protein